MKDANKTYNLAVGHVLREKLHHLEVYNNTDKNQLKTVVRNLFVTVKGNDPCLRHRTPKDIRDNAARSVVSTIEAFKKKSEKRQWLREKYPATRKFKDDIKFQPGFRSSTSFKTAAILAGKNGTKRTSSNVVMIKSKFRTYNGDRPFKDGITVNQSIPDEFVDENGKFLCDYKIRLAEDGEFYLMLTHYVSVSSMEDQDHSIDKHNIVAIDPGIRKFATCYSPEGKVEIIGANVTHVLDKHFRRIDRKEKRLTRLQAQVVDAKSKRNKRRRVCRARKQAIKAKQRLRNTVDDFHYKLAVHLCSSYDTIIWPDFNMIGMSGLPSVVVKRGQALRHATFKNRLQATSTKFPSTRVIHGSEAYTSKTCGNCGIQNNDLGASETWTCSARCGCLPADRDVHAARNILLRFINS
jgi:transposase